MSKANLNAKNAGRSAKEGVKERKKRKVGYSHKRFFILAQVTKKNTGGSVSLLVLNSIIDVEESVSFLRYRQSSTIPKINPLFRPNLGFVFAAIIARSFGNLLPCFLLEKRATFFKCTGRSKRKKKRTVLKCQPRGSRRSARFLFYFLGSS